MRFPSSKPKSLTSAYLIGGYQLCARCGAVLVEGDPVNLARRLSDWIIYTHPHCPQEAPKAVRGWLAVRRAELVREKPNVETLREATPYVLLGASRQCTCVLDREHIKVELGLVSYHPSDETAESQIVETKQQCADKEEEGTDANDLFSVRAIAWSRPHPSHPIQTAFAAAFDNSSSFDALEFWEQIKWACRKESYATFRETPEQPSSPIISTIEKEQTVAAHALEKSILGNLSQGAVLTFDTKDVAAEHALYSLHRIINDAGTPSSELDLWIRYEAERARPRPVELGYNRGTNPERYEWSESRRKPRLATLKREWLDEKRAADEIVQYLLGWWIMCGARSARSDVDVFYLGVTKEEGDLYKRYAVSLKFNLADSATSRPLAGR
jgi:hypothetical protein